MLAWFENRLPPFPPDRFSAPPEKLVPFCWHYVKDARWWLFAMAGISALIAIGEVLLFGFLGQLVDRLTVAGPETFLSDNAGLLLSMGLVLVIGLPLAVLASSLIVHQTLLGNLPMSARWRMHRLLLGQSLSFFADEFAGRVATKVMQSSLAVREAVMKLLDILVYVSVYFLTMLVLIASADWRLLAPMIIWFGVYLAIIRFFVPRLRDTSERQADARSAMTGRIVDSYTNIATVKLFAHAGREEAYARDSMDRFLKTVHPQMRLVTGFQCLIYLNNCLMIFAIAALGVWLWGAGAITIGAITVAVGLALRMNGMSEWIMWEVSALFENIGVIHDGMEMLKKPIDVVDAPGAAPLAVKAGAVAFENIRFHYGKDQKVIDGLSLEIAPGEKIGLVGRSGAGKTTLTNLLLRFLRP